MYVKFKGVSFHFEYLKAQIIIIYSVQREHADAVGPKHD
jgi:hypothetical protein